MFVEFINQSLRDVLSVLEKMTKRNLEPAKSECATTEIKIGNQLFKIKEERNFLLRRFIVISRSRPELDLKVCIEEFDFGAVPRSFFTVDGCLLLPYGKASILHKLENLLNN